MFEEENIVVIKSRSELPTKWHGSKGTIVKIDFMAHQGKGFHKVLVWDCGEVFVFHESQLEKVERL